MEEKKKFESPEIIVTKVNDVIRTSGDRDDDEWVILGMRYYW